MEHSSLTRLLEGNRRFVSGNALRPHQSPARRIEISDAQHPFAVVLGCSDSRVPPELIFDQGLGDLYVIRVAGHVPDGPVLASLEHAVDYLHIPLVVVLGHQRCGAVELALESDPKGHLARLARAIRPAVDRGKLQPTTLLESAVRANTDITVRYLRGPDSPLAAAVKEARVEVVGAYYDLSSGGVTIME